MAQKKTAGRLKVAFAFLLLFGPAFLLVLFATRSCSHQFKTLPELGPAAAYSFTDVDGKKRTFKDFEGDIVLINTLQVTCPNECAISLVNLNLQIFQLAKNIDDKGVKIISYVTDGKGNPVTDLTQVQAMLMDRINDFDPEIWILASGPVKEVFDITHDGRSLLEETGDSFFGGFAFQEMMILIDKTNQLRMIRSGAQEGYIREMKQHIALLQKQYDKDAYGKK